MIVIIMGERLNPRCSVLVSMEIDKRGHLSIAES